MKKIFKYHKVRYEVTQMGYGLYTVVGLYSKGKRVGTSNLSYHFDNIDSDNLSEQQSSRKYYHNLLNQPTWKGA